MNLGTNICILSIVFGIHELFQVKEKRGIGEVSINSHSWLSDRA